MVDAELQFDGLLTDMGYIVSEESLDTIGRYLTAAGYEVSVNPIKTGAHMTIRDVARYGRYHTLVSDIMDAFSRSDIPYVWRIEKQWDVADKEMIVMHFLFEKVSVSGGD